MIFWCQTVHRVLQIHFWGEVAGDSTGSVEKIIYATATRLNNFHVDVACKGDRDLTRVERGVSFHVFSEDHIKNKIFNKILGLGTFTFSRLLKIIENTKPDILHFHNRHELVDRVARKISYRPKIICHYHRHFQQLCVPDSAGRLVAVSADIEKYIVTQSGTSKKIVVLGNPISDRAIEFGKDSASPHNSVPKILFPGGAQAHKGFGELIEAADNLDAAGQNYQLLLAGPQLDKFSPTSGKVRNLGYLGADEYYSALADSDIFVLPSHHEGLSVAALEALYFKKILVVTRGPFQDFLDDSNAILVEPRNSQSLYGGLRKAIELPSGAAQTLRQKAYDTSLGFLPEKIASGLEAIYEQLLGKN